MPAKRHLVRAAKTRSTAAVGKLPEWNLADLYQGMDDPQIARDLDRSDVESVAFEEQYKGKLNLLAAAPGAGTALAEAVKRYE
ncbi:MAG TPA: oligoendopeptidase F, partial [Xanthobacteraceae bacterium]